MILMKNNLALKNTKYIYILALILPLLPLYLVFYKPILFPFADDWLVIGWSYQEKDLIDIHSIQLVNGHQIFLSKALIYLIGYISAGNIQLISLVTIAMGFIGVFFLVQSQIIFLGDKANVIFVLSVLLISGNYKQMQNLFMPICNGWMMAIFFIGIYYWLKQKKEFNSKKYLIGLTVVLAPLTIGLGIILPIIELVEVIYKMFKGKSYLSTFKNQLFTFLVSFISIIFFFSIPLLKMTDGSGFESEKNIGNMLNVIKDPIGSLMYLLTLTGNIFVPASRFEPTLPIVAGSLFIFSSSWILLKNRSRIRIEDILLNKNCMLGGLVFISILFLFRYSGDLSDIQTVAAPRYVSGSLIFIIGVLGLIQKVGTNRKIITSFLLITCSLTLVSGLKTGIEWHSTRYKQSLTLIECAKAKDSLNTKFVEGQPCFTLAYENSMSPSKDYFKLELRKFVEIINNE
jgi:hypothetical protein